MTTFMYEVLCPHCGLRPGMVLDLPPEKIADVTWPADSAFACPACGGSIDLTENPPTPSDRPLPGGDRQV